MAWARVGNRFLRILYQFMVEEYDKASERIAWDRRPARFTNDGRDAPCNSPFANEA